ncbi:MAG: serine/threonine protein kinase [Planctomycetota bacterium]|nr:serine/threonine protein kinase [Planctomycetaceae bacterium]MDQ3329953.1 serine/threonine protein kinase [Planctomycetota bacterium]
MSSPSEGAAAKRKLGPFVLGQKLGVGGMGIVYRAVYEKNGSDVAVKVLSPALSGNAQVAARFEREMAILKRLRHPNIVQYFGGGRSGGQQFFAMEYVPGGSVEQLVKKKGKLPWEESLSIMRQVAEALEYSHSNGIIHRDLKPANLFFTGSGDRVKLGDFGIARDGDATALTAAGKTVGTYAYMAPEQISGKPPISRRTDLYALGCVGFELLTGRPPFVAETPAEMLFGHLNGEPPRVREFSIDCPMWLDDVIARLLEKDPEDRYFDALAVQMALDEVKQKVEEQEGFVKQTLQGATTAANTIEGRALKELVGGKAKKKRKSKAVPLYERAWFLALCLLLLIGGVTWALWPASEAELYAQAATLMRSDDDADWFTAREQYLLPLVERFPEGKHVKEAKTWLDKIELHQIEDQAENRVRRNQKPRNEAERLLMDAIQAEGDDKIIAIGKYHTMVKLVSGDGKTEAYGRIAKGRAARLEAQIGGDEKVSLVQSALRRAEREYEAGRVKNARDIWHGVIDTYGDSNELAPHVRFAVARLEGYDPPPLDLGEDEPNEDGAGDERR